MFEALWATSAALRRPYSPPRLTSQYASLPLFILQHYGRINRVELLRSSGSKILDKEAWEAVLNASPFEPLPPMVGRDLIA
jgi:hypothetical protein